MILIIDLGSSDAAHLCPRLENDGISTGFRQFLGARVPRRAGADDQLGNVFEHCPRDLETIATAVFAGYFCWSRDRRRSPGC